jgi:serine-type D-Ala-D-Ala carboxypeptidase/endopeptidase
MNERLFIILLIPALHLSAAVESAAQVPRQAEIEALAQNYVKKGRIRGLAVGVVYGDQVMAKGFGDLGSTLSGPPGENTLFDLGAVTSVFTTTLMMQESMKGRFDIGESIQGYMPQDAGAPIFQPIKCVEITLPGQPVRRIVSCSPDPMAEEICIGFCDLASHAAGLPNSLEGFYVWNPFVEGRAMPADLQDCSREEIFSRLQEVELKTAPGLEFRYSNLGIALLGHLLSDIAGISYDSLLQRNLTGPLGMKDTRLALSADQESRLAPGHDPRGRRIGRRNMAGMAPAAGLKSSLQDMLIFLRANIHTDDKKLASTFEQVHQARIDVRFPGVSKNTQAGYGWIISLLSEQSNLPVVWINGGANGSRAFIGFNKDKNMGVVLLSNSPGPVTELGFQMLRAMIE